MLGYHSIPSDELAADEAMKTRPRLEIMSWYVGSPIFDHNFFVVPVDHIQQQHDDDMLLHGEHTMMT
jgi:hypothetical protein